MGRRLSTWCLGEFIIYILWAVIKSSTQGVNEARWRVFWHLCLYGGYDPFISFINVLLESFDGCSKQAELILPLRGLIWSLLSFIVKYRVTPLLVTCFGKFYYRIFRRGTPGKSTSDLGFAYCYLLSQVRGFQSLSYRFLWIYGH